MKLRKVKIYTPFQVDLPYILSIQQMSLYQLRSFRAIARPLTLSALLFATNTSYALPLQIFDCNGTSRATSDVAQNSRNELRVDVKSTTGQPVNQADVTLTNANTGEVMSASEVTEGQAVFNSVPPGDWVIGSANPNLAFSTISVGQFVTPVVAYSAAAGTGLAGAGAAAGGYETVSGTDNNNDDSGSGNGDGTGGDGSGDGGGETPNTEPTPEPTAEPTVVPEPTPQPTPCPECNPDEEPDPIDDFFNKQKAQENDKKKGTARSKIEVSKSQHAKSTADCFIGSDVEPMSPFL